MKYPNTLIFVDFPATDPASAAEFYAGVFGWEVEPRPAGSFYRIVPGQQFLLDDGTPGPTGNLHMGLFDAANARPHPDPAGVAPRDVAHEGQTMRTWILVSDDDSMDRILGEAESRGSQVLWRNHYWAEFNGFNSAFKDPWGNTFILWVKGGDDPVIAEGMTSE